VTDRRRNWLRRALVSGATIVVLYAIGFYAVMLPLRSDSETARHLAMKIDWALYGRIVNSSPDGSLLRDLNVDRFRSMCRGYETRCRVSDE
jgi:hypothetical protein